MLLWRTVLASRALEKGAGAKETLFYEGQVKSAQFFIEAVLPVTLGRMAAIDALSGAVVEIPEAAFFTSIIQEVGDQWKDDGRGVMGEGR